MPNLLFHLQFPPPEMAMGIVHNIIFESLDGFEWFTILDGLVNMWPGVVNLQAGPTDASMAHINKKIAHQTEKYAWDKKRTFKVKAWVYIDSDPNPSVYIGIGDPISTLNGIVFKFLKNKIQALYSNNYTSTEVDLITGLPDGWNGTYLFKFIFNPGENIMFYIDDTLKATCETDLPEGDGNQEWIFHTHVQNTNTHSNQLEFSQVRLDQDL